jgi:hypothetical protein
MRSDMCPNLPTLRRLALMALVCLCSCTCCRASAYGLSGFRPEQDTHTVPRLTYTKILKGSTPESVLISVDANGSGVYEGRKLEEPSSPKPIKISAATTRTLFDLVSQLANLDSIDLESHKKVANLGTKTLIYEDGAHKNQVEFNYTLNRNAQELVELFEKITAVEIHLQGLQYAIKYDHLGLPQELLQIQIDLDNKALADPELLVPTLDEIARNPRFLHLAQVRAQNILQRLQNDR